MKYKEVEFKYNAENIKLSDFIQFCLKRNPLKIVEASGYDYFYENSKSDNSFCRHRIGPDMNQLTFKRKTSNINNQIRTEHNIDLVDEVSTDQVKALCEEFNYKYNMSIFKNCFIYVYDYYTLVYYICYDKDMKELGRFLEIEAKEDHAWDTEQSAWDAIAVIEKFSKSLGIAPQGRIKRSLFELYRNKNEP